MTTRLYYGSPRPRGVKPDDLTHDDLPPDGDFYDCYDEGRPLVVEGIRLTKDPNAWCPTDLLISVDIRLADADLADYRLHQDRKHESYDLPENLVNSSRRRWVRDEDAVVRLMIRMAEDE